MKQRTIISLMMSAGLLVSSIGRGQTSPGISKMLNTKHNLGISGPGPIKAKSEDQLCLFCHTPHVPSGYSADQLWNHQPSGATYVLYSSDYLTSLSYAEPNQPNPRSKLCLSCHDGTVAIGAVYNNGGGPATIEMENGVTTMPPTAAGYLGTSLANDHPVGYVYDNARDPELVGRQWPWRTPVRLDPDASVGTVECQTCHDPHDDKYTHFLNMSNSNAALCTFCHNKTGWSGAVHQTSNQAYTPPGEAGTTVGEWACRDCHKSHGGSGVPYLLTGVEESTCYASGCHGSSQTGAATKNIQSELDKMYSHPTNSVSGKHRNPDNAASLNAPNRHAECADCHNGHQAKSGLHSVQSNLASNALAGVRGVQPNASAEWTQPLSFTPVSPSQEENQVCFKCHSSYAFGPVPNGVSTIVGPSAEFITDQAMEFNPANHSAHPVEVASNNQTGALTPKGLSAAQMSIAWNAVGTQTMYCSDCHGNDQPVSSTVPQGPHGSNNRFMLTGQAKFWPTNATGQLWSLADLKNGANNWQNDLFCVNCHPMYDGVSFKNNVHAGAEHQQLDVRCISCHVAVPHGARRSRLIGYASDAAPYNYSGTGTYDKLVISGFQKAAGPTTYQVNNCTMAGVCHGAQAGVYEP